MLPKNSPRLINAWSSYDWANSVYNLIVTTAIFPVYYANVTAEAFGGEMVRFLGIEISSSVLFTYAISLSFLVVVFTSPILSGIADYTGSKRRFMQFFTYLGSLSCIGLFFFEGPNIEYGIACSVLASVGYAGALVFYNGFLPQIVTPDKMDNVSARGFTFGYIGSVILLLINLVLLMMPETFGFENTKTATQFGFLLVGFWWMGFAQIGFYYLRDRPTGKTFDRSILGRGLNELRQIGLKIRERSVLKRYLSSFFAYSMGVSTVMLLAPLFASKVVGIESTEMIVVVLILQILAMVGAIAFAWISNRGGNRLSITIILALWIFVCIASYFLEAKMGFYGLAAVIGIGMGGVQSVSRATYSRLIPKGTVDTASYFSFYEVTEKLAIVIGTFSFGLINQMTGNMRNSMLFMVVFFGVGLLILQMTDLAGEMRRVEQAPEVVAEDDYDHLTL
jgi:UMF1 family MFS transporter